MLWGEREGSYADRAAQLVDQVAPVGGGGPPEPLEFGMPIIATSVEWITTPIKLGFEIRILVAYFATTIGPDPWGSA